MPFVFEEESTQTPQPRYVVEKDKPGLIDRVKSALPAMPPVGKNLAAFGKTFESPPIDNRPYAQRAAEFREKVKAGEYVGDPVKRLFPEEKIDPLGVAGKAIKSGIEDVGRSVISAYESLDPTRAPTTTKPGASLLHGIEPVLGIMSMSPPAIGGTMAGETVRSGLESAGASPEVQATLGVLSNIAVPGGFVPKVVRGVSAPISPARQAAIDVGRARVKSKRAAPAFADTMAEQLRPGKLADESGFTTGAKGAAPEGRYVFEQPEVSSAKAQPTPIQEAGGQVVPPVVEAVAPKDAPVLTAPEVVAKSQDLEVKAHEAATSPMNDLPEPTQAQKEAGNYKKGHVSWSGLDVTIENPQGSTRSGVDPNGKPWSVEMPAHYGYLKRTKGADGDQVDIYLGKTPSDKVYVVDQIDAKTGKFDEHKLIGNVESLDEANALYDAGFSDQLGPQRRGATTEMSVPELKKWLNDGDTTKPLAESASLNENPKPITEMSMDELLAAADGVRPTPQVVPPTPEVAPKPVGGKKEIRLDAEGYTKEQLERVFATAKERGINASSDGRFILFRELEKPAPEAPAPVTPREAAKAKAAERVAKAKESSVTDERIIEVGLVREYGGKWQWRAQPGDSWFTSNNKAGAMEQGRKYYEKLPESERLNPQQRYDRATAEQNVELERRYGHMSRAEIESKLEALGGELTGLRKTAKREFTGQGTRRSGPAMAAEGARMVGQERMDLQRYYNDKFKAIEATPAKAEAKIESGIEKTKGAKEQQRVKKELATRIEALIKAAPTEAANDAKAKEINATRPTQPMTLWDKGIPKKPTDAQFAEYRKDLAKWDKKHGPELERLEKGTITIEIPGDGTFKIRRTQEALTEILKRVNKIETNIPRDIRNQPMRAIPIPKRRGDLPADVWYESSDPTHWVTNSTGVKLKGMPIEVEGIDTPLYVTSGGEAYRIVEPKTGLALGDEASSIARAVVQAQEAFKRQQEKATFQNEPPLTIAELIKKNMEGTKAKVEEITPESLAEFDKAREIPEQYKPKGEAVTEPTQPTDLSTTPVIDLIKKGFGSETGTVGRLTPEQAIIEAQARAAREEIYRRIKVEAEKAGETIEATAERLKLPPGLLSRIMAEQEPPPAPPAAIPATSESPEGGFVTSIKNAQVDKELSDMGLPPASHGERVSFEQSRAEAARAMQLDPFAGQKLVNDLVARPRPATAFEDALLLHEQTRLKNERIAAEELLIAAQKSGEPTVLAEAKARVDAITADFMTVGDVVTQTGTQSSLSLGHRRMMMKEDYSLASMERAKQIANEGAPLTDAQRAEVKALHEKINATQKAFDEYVAKAEQRKAEMESEIAHSRMMAEERPAIDVDPHVKSMAERIVAAMESQAESARARLKAKLSSLHAGVDPTILSDMAIIGAAKIARGALDFTHWSKAMISDLGEKVSPYLKDVWDASNQRLDERIERMAGGIREPVKRVVKKMDLAERQVAVKEQIKFRMQEGADISQQAQTLAKIFIERGIKERDELIDAVHKQLEEIDPNITRRQTMDAISGYGKYSQLSHDQINNELRDLKGQMQQLAKLEDIQSRKPLLRTGVEHRAISDEERHLIQQVNEAKRRYGVVITDPATQLQSALGARKTYYRNAISDLEAQIRAKEKFVKEKTASPTDPELLSLKARHGELKKQFDEVFGKPEMTDEQRIAAAIRGTERSIANLEKRIAENDVGPHEKTPPLSSPALDAVRARRDALQAQLQELRDIAYPGKTPEEIALQTLKTRLKHQTADMLDRLERGDFAKKARREIPFDKEALRLQFEAAKVKAKFNEALLHDRLAHRTTKQKIIGSAGEALNTSRAILTGIDLSAVLRQGGFTTFAHPIRSARAFPAMIRALASEKGAYRATQEILNRENYPLYKQSKLYLAEEGVSLSRMEEAYMSRWADKIPLVAGSQRAYTTFLNKLRADSFDAMAKTLGRSDKLTPEEAGAIANFINVSTGRGHLGLNENALVGLNTVFFAPRYVASRFQLLLGQPFYSGTARTRVAIAKEYARTLTGLATVYGLASMAGAEIEVDPRSSDFGKIKVGNTRVDPMMGLSQATVLMSRLASGETKSARGKVFALRGDRRRPGAPGSADVIGRFLRTKLSPSVGTGINILEGANVVGEPTTPESVALGLTVPLAMQDIYKAMEDQGVPRGAALGVLGLFGMSLQTFDAKNKRVPDRRTFSQRWGFGDSVAVNE